MYGVCGVWCVVCGVWCVWRVWLAACVRACVCGVVGVVCGVCGVCGLRRACVRACVVGVVCVCGVWWVACVACVRVVWCVHGVRPNSSGFSNVESHGRNLTKTCPKPTENVANCGGECAISAMLDKKKEKRVLSCPKTLVSVRTCEHVGLHA